MPSPSSSQRVTRANESAAQRKRREAAQRLVGSRTAEAREDKGLTQAKLGEKVGCTMRYIQSVEQGQTNLTLGSLTRLAHILGLELAELFAPSTRQRRGPGRPGKKLG